MKAPNDYNFTSGTKPSITNQNDGSNNFLFDSNKDSVSINNFSDHFTSKSDAKGLCEANKQQGSFFSPRVSNHTHSKSNVQLEKLKKELEKVKKHDSLNRSKNRNGHSLCQQSINQVFVNLKSEVISKYKANPEALVKITLDMNDIKVMVEKTHSYNQRQSQSQLLTGDLQQQSKALSRSSSAQIFQQALSNNEKCLNTKVFVRFRPLNKVEVELTKNDLGNDCCLYPDEKTVVLMPESTVFTMDSVFDPNTSQNKIYEIVGRETIADVMNGYNGTIFAYGQTGSGKTYSMFGEIHHKNLKGLIPRSIEHIFKTINSCDVDIEFILTCSILEIYKENLHDLLCNQKTDLKIKESPTRGIYVEGLTQLCVATENELLTMLELGDQARKVAATRINQYSSRSHTIFMLEIKQRFPNDTEKKGKLNLVDLAGSEKVGKTGAMGEILEEAKKINLSLSCLGNVIHSLTTNSDHIPYRDSKLTRILQESLGGNFKTSLLVTCSSHSSSLEETLSTLKFATRAKSIKNHFKMNIKNSPEALQRIIHQLKKDLVEARQENEKLKKFQEVAIPTEDAIQNLPSYYDSSVLMNMNKAIFKKNDQYSPDTNKLQDQLPQKYSEEVELEIGSLQRNAILQERVEDQSAQLLDYKQTIQEMEATIRKQDEQIEALKRENITLQVKLSQKEQKEGFNLKKEDSSTIQKGDQNEREKTLAALKAALEKQETTQRDLFKVKADSIDQGFKSVIQQVKQMPLNWENMNKFLSESENTALQFKPNISLILKDIKACISNQQVSKYYLQELANSIQASEQQPQSDANKDNSNLYFQIYQILRLETMHSSLQYSIGSLEIQECLNYQKYKLLKDKHTQVQKQNEQLIEVLNKARNFHQIMNIKIDNLEEQQEKSKLQVATNLQAKPKSKVIQMVVHNGGAQSQSIQPSSQDLTEKEDNSNRNVNNLSKGASKQTIKLKLHEEGEGGKEEHDSIQLKILVDENTRLREKILVKTSDLELANTNIEMMKMELIKRNEEVQKLNQLLKVTKAHLDTRQKDDFLTLNKKLDEWKKPICQEILAYYKKQNIENKNSQQKSEMILPIQSAQLLHTLPSSEFPTQRHKPTFSQQVSSKSSIASPYCNQNINPSPLISSTNFQNSSSFTSPVKQVSNNQKHLSSTSTPNPPSLPPTHTAKNSIQNLGFRYDYSFLQDSTLRQQNKGVYSQSNTENVQKQ